MSLGDQIRAAISRQSKSIYHLAMEVKVDEQNLRRFIRGEAGLSLAALDRISAYLQLQVSPVQGGSSNPK